MEATGCRVHCVFGALWVHFSFASKVLEGMSEDSNDDAIGVYGELGGLATPIPKSRTIS